MRIQFHPYFHMAEATHVLSGLVWAYDEVKEIDPELTVRWNTGGQTAYVKILDDLLSSDQYRHVDVDADGNVTAHVDEPAHVEEQPAATQDETPSADPDN